MPETPHEARLLLVTPHAVKFALDPKLVCAVCEQESSWNPAAIRFEPAFEARYIKPALPSAPTTLELTKAMSFGLMQVMGEVAVELGWKGAFLTELCDPDVGLEYGCAKLAKCFAAHPNSPDAALLAYNGGGNLFYPLQVMQRMKNY